MRRTIGVSPRRSRPHARRYILSTGGKEKLLVAFYATRSRHTDIQDILERDAVYMSHCLSMHISVSSDYAVTYCHIQPDYKYTLDGDVLIGILPLFAALSAFRIGYPGQHD